MTTTTHQLIVTAPMGTIAAFADQLENEDDLLEAVAGVASRDNPFLLTSRFAVHDGQPHMLTVTFTEDGQCGEMGELRIGAQQLSAQMQSLVTYNWLEPLSSAGGEFTFLCAKLVIERDCADW